MSGTSFCLVSFHAHPDDEALLTGGTLARAAAEGHRVVLVTATRGRPGWPAPPTATGSGSARGGPTSSTGRPRPRLRQGDPAGLRRLGLSRTTSGPGRVRLAAGRPSPPTAGRDPARGAGRRLTIYDRNGGYGHPDHVQVHRVGHRAAELAGTPLVLEATVDRIALIRALSLVRWTRLLLPEFAPDRLRHSYSTGR